jgi:hypothetical protein
MGVDDTRTVTKAGTIRITAVPFTTDGGRQTRLQSESSSLPTGRVSPHDT